MLLYGSHVLIWIGGGAAGRGCELVTLSLKCSFDFQRESRQDRRAESPGRHPRRAPTGHSPRTQLQLSVGQTWTNLRPLQHLSVAQTGRSAAPLGCDSTDCLRPDESSSSARRRGQYQLGTQSSSAANLNAVLAQTEVTATDLPRTKCVLSFGNFLKASKDFTPCTQRCISSIA